MPLNQIYNPTIVYPVTVASEVAQGTPLDVNGTPAVAYTASGGHTVTVTSGLPGNLTSITRKDGGVGLGDLEVSAAFDGTFEFAVTGVTTSTESGVPVYYITSGTGAGTLNLSDSAGTTRIKFGVTNYPKDYTKEAGRAPVRIGAVNG